MKDANAKKRKKNRIRPYQRNANRDQDLDKEEKVASKSAKKDINANKDNKKDIPELKVGIKRKVQTL